MTLISFDNPNNDRYSLRIYDQKGKLVKEINNISESAIELNRSNLLAGIYFVELAGKTTRRAKVLIE